MTSTKYAQQEKTKKTFSHFSTAKKQHLIIMSHPISQVESHSVTISNKFNLWNDSIHTLKIRLNLRMDDSFYDDYSYY